MYQFSLSSIQPQLAGLGKFKPWILSFMLISRRTDLHNYHHDDNDDDDDDDDDDGDHHYIVVVLASCTLAGIRRIK